MGSGSSRAHQQVPDTPATTPANKAGGFDRGVRNMRVFAAIPLLSAISSGASQYMGNDIVCVQYEIVCSGGTRSGSAEECNTVCVEYGFSQTTDPDTIPVPVSPTLSSEDDYTDLEGYYEGYYGGGRASPQQFVSQPFYGSPHVGNQASHPGHQHGGHSYGYGGSHSHGGYGGHSHGRQIPAPVVPAPAPVRSIARRPIVGGKMGGGKMGVGRGGYGYFQGGTGFSYGDDAIGVACVSYQTICAGGSKAMAKSGMSMGYGAGSGCRQVCVEYASPAPGFTVPAPTPMHGYNSNFIPSSGHSQYAGHDHSQHSHSAPVRTSSNHHHSSFAVPAPAPIPAVVPSRAVRPMIRRPLCRGKMGGGKMGGGYGGCFGGGKMGGGYFSDHYFY